MISVKDARALTRHEVVGLLEEAIYGAEQYWGNCYVVDQLSMLAYRIAEGEAGFVEDDEEATEKQTCIVETLLDAYADMMQEVITEKHFKNIISNLSNDEVIELIEVAWFYRTVWREERTKKGEIPNETSGTYTDTESDDEMIMYEDTYNICDPTSDKLVALLNEIVNHPHYTTSHSNPKKVKNTTETIQDGLEKAILALNIIVELYSTEQKKE